MKRPNPLPRSRCIPHIHRPAHAPSTLQLHGPTDMIVAVLENRGVAKPVAPAMACGTVETLSLQALVEACDADKFLKHLLSTCCPGQRAVR